MTGMPRGHVVAVGVGAVAVFGCLVGCSSGDGGRPPPATSSSSKPTTPPVPRPTLPVTATADQKGAEVFVRYFWDTYNYAYATGDTGPLKEITGSPCVFCHDVADRAERIVGHGGRITGARVTVLELLAPPGVERGAIVTVILRQEASKSLDADGTVLGSSPALGVLSREVGRDRVTTRSSGS